jgi:hypothetical protein
MSEIQQERQGPAPFSTRRNVPVIEKIGGRDIEVTFLGMNSLGRLTWILWNPGEPLLIGVLTQGHRGFTLEQRTSGGVMLHENVPLSRVQHAIGG